MFTSVFYLYHLNSCSSSTVPPALNLQPIRITLSSPGMHCISTVLDSSTAAVRYRSVIAVKVSVYKQIRVLNGVSAFKK